MADEKPRRQRSAAKSKALKQPKLNPQWWAPVMVTFMLVGLLWVVVWYLTSRQYPVEALGNWNLVIGFSIIMVGFGMATNWK